MPKYYYHWSSPNTQTIEEARTHKLLSYIYVDQVTNVPCSFFPQSAVDDNGYVPLVNAKDRLHHKHDQKTPLRMSEISLNMESQRIAANLGHQFLSLPKLFPWFEGLPSPTWPMVL